MRDRDLVRLYWPVELRPAFDALFGIDDALAEIVTSSTQPALGAIRLAWWREALERLDRALPPPEPRLLAAADVLLPRGISGAMLARLAEGWAGMLDEVPEMTLLEERGARLFEMAARLLNVEFEDETHGAAGRLFAGIDAGRRGMMDVVAGRPGSGGRRIARRARPITGLAALAARDLRRGGPPFEPEATPARAWILLRHRMFGMIP
ncbi:MAG: squalene/phytoene synthase family protein [Pseudomonadota bacterium]|nr:squalene/phytoene synthase family protein [Pseudomonadota bacterium]